MKACAFLTFLLSKSPSPGFVLFSNIPTGPYQIILLCKRDNHHDCRIPFGVSFGSYVASIATKRCLSYTSRWHVRTRLHSPLSGRDLGMVRICHGNKVFLDPSFVFDLDFGQPDSSGVGATGMVPPTFQRLSTKPKGNPSFFVVDKIGKRYSYSGLQS